MFFALPLNLLIPRLDFTTLKSLYFTNKSIHQQIKSYFQQIDYVDLNGYFLEHADWKITKFPKIINNPEKIVIAKDLIYLNNHIYDKNFTLPDIESFSDNVIGEFNHSLVTKKKSIYNSQIAYHLLYLEDNKRKSKPLCRFFKDRLKWLSHKISRKEFISILHSFQKQVLPPSFNSFPFYPYKLHHDFKFTKNKLYYQSKLIVSDINSYYAYYDLLVTSHKDGISIYKLSNLKKVIKKIDLGPGQILKVVSCPELLIYFLQDNYLHQISFKIK